MLHLFSGIRVFIVKWYETLSREQKTAAFGQRERCYRFSMVFLKNQTLLESLAGITLSYIGKYKTVLISIYQGCVTTDKAKKQADLLIPISSCAIVIGRNVGSNTHSYREGVGILALFSP